MPAMAIVQNAVLPVLQHREEPLKAGESGRFDEFAPALKPGLGGDPIRSAFTARGQRRAQQVNAGQGWALLEQGYQLVLLGQVQGRPFPT